MRVDARDLWAPGALFAKTADSMDQGLHLALAEPSRTAKKRYVNPSDDASPTPTPRMIIKFLPVAL
jgi:hypothetical protein